MKEGINMREWFIKTFFKSKAVRIYIAYPDKRLQEFWAIPKGDQVNIKGVGVFTISLEEGNLSSKNVPTYIFNTLSTSPLNLQTGEKSVYTPEQFQVAIDSKIEREIFLATKTGALSQDTIYILLALMVGFGGLGYYLSDKINTIIEALATLGIS